VTTEERQGVKAVSNPKDHHELTGVLRSAVEGISGSGYVFIDSLTEFFTMSEPTSAIETIKNWRAELCKLMNITVFASYHVGVKSIDEYAGMLDYASDGVIDFRFDPLMEQQGLLVRQLRVRKMKGASHGTEWRYFVVEKRGLIELKHHMPKPPEDSHK
jgi:KaiC/GvpD/RAD55 family RecA-like ATPase